MMKCNLTLICCLVFATGQVWAGEKKDLKDGAARLSYSIGASIGKNLKKDSADIDLDVLIQGMKAGLAGEQLLLSEKEIRQVMNDYQTQLRQHAMTNNQLALIENKKNGEAFLAENKNKKGVLVLQSGVQYKVLKEGNGKRPLESDMVEVNYRGTLINGKEFDATEPGHPASLKVSSLIAGWKQALSMMPEGSKWQIVIPSQLAYGERGVGNDIGPNEVLVFELELVAIK